MIKGCGVDWIETIDPYRVKEMVDLLKEARKYTQEEDGGIAAIIARHPCLIHCPDSHMDGSVEVEITDDCDSCGYCLDYFECPALYLDTEKERVEINRNLCVDCGVCINACPKGAIVEKP